MNAKRWLPVAVIVATLTFAAPSGADTQRTRIISTWNGTEVGTYYVEHPRKLGFQIGRNADDGYWLIRHAHWKHWGEEETTAKGKLASASLDGTGVTIRAWRRAYHSCVRQGDTVYVYLRVTIHIAGESGWRPIDRGSLAPQCNNP